MWHFFTEIFKNFGFIKSIFIIFFIGAHIWIYCLYRGRLNDRQKEIDRLAKDNREYRERFLSLMDKQFNYNPGPNSKNNQSGSNR